MAGATMTTFDSALKEDYQPAIRVQVNNTFKMLSQVAKNTESFEGRRAVLSLETARTSGVGARKEGDDSPTPGAADFGEERISVRTQVGRVSFTVQAMDASKSDAGSFGRVAKREMTSLKDNLYRGVNRQIYGTSNGVIATCTTTSGSATVNLATTTTQVQIEQFEQNMRIDIGTVAQAGALTGGRVHGAVISSIDETAGAMTLTIDSSVTTAGTDFVFQNAAGGTTTNQRELTGLQTIVAASGSLFNIDPATDLLWKSTVDSNSGTNRAISEALLEKNIQTVARRSGKDIDFIVASTGVYRSVTNLMRSLKRFTGTIELKGGHSAQSIDAGTGPTAIIWERDCPSNQLFGLTLDNLIEFVMQDWTWMDDDGAILNRVANKLQYEATMYKEHELATDRRNAHFLIKDITES